MWETPATLNDTWGFKENDHNWKTPAELVFKLVDIVSKGGNYLLNVGPTGEGIIPPGAVNDLQAVGAWMKINGEAIYGTTASPLKQQPAWGRVTQRGGALYLHVFDWPADGKILVPGLTNQITAATLLATGEKLKVQSAAEGVAVSVPAAAPDKISSTIVLKLER